MRNAVLLFITFAFVFIACSSENEKDLTAKADQLLKDQKYNEALAVLEKITVEFPKTNEAGLAYLEIAKLYQGKAIKGISYEQSFLKAVENYQVVTDKYPDLDEAPGALFMTGFLQANEINDYEAAKLTYQKFLDRYPDHELAASAKSELENIGLTPEQILEKAVAQPK